MANLKYYLGPWQWVTTGGPSRWSAPTGTVGLVDLRGIPSQALAGTLGSNPIGFFCVSPTVTLPSEYTLLGTGDCRDLNATNQNRNAWQSLLGYRPTGTKLVDLLWNQLTQGSDPTGDTPTSPLMPTTEGGLEIHLAGHSIVKREQYQHGIHSHSGKVEDVLRLAFRRQFADGSQTDHCRRVLDYWLDKYRLPKSEWQRFVPQDLRAHIPGPLPHATTITESFNTTDGDTLGPDLTWAEFRNDFAGNASSSADSWDIESNTAVVSTGVVLCLARAASDLSGDDHYAQLVLADITSDNNIQLGPVCRFEVGTGDNDLYLCRAIQVNDTLVLSKMVGGTLSDISSTSQTPGNTATVKIQANGSTIKGFYNGSELLSSTDTSITGHTRCGLFGFTAGGNVDSFEAADLSAGASVSITRLASYGISRPYSITGAKSPASSSVSDLVGGKLVRGGILLKGLVR